MTNPNELIEAARAVLGEVEESPAVQERPLVPQVLTSIPESSAQLIEGGISQVVAVEPQTAPITATTFQKFGELPQHLREGEGINLIEVKKLNLAVAVEALERASTAHENFPSPDAGIAVASLSDQIMKLIKDLEKSHDPQKILDDLVDNALAKLTQEIVQDLAIEMRRLRDDTLVMVRAEKQEAFDQAFKIAVNRMGPALRERLDVAITRIARVLNVKEKPANARSHS